MKVGRPWRHWVPASGGFLTLTWAAGRRWEGCAAEAKRFEEPERVIKEEELRLHNQVADAWISFDGSVYDITRYIQRHPPCEGLHWAQRVAGRRFEHFLGRDAFGPAHLGCGPDANCSRGVKVELAKMLEPYRIGRFQAAEPSPAAGRWPDVEAASAQLRLEWADGSLIQVLTMEDLQKFKKRTKTVTHKCTTSGNVNSQEWSGVPVKDLLPERPASTWDPLVTFIGMDGFGYSIFLSRASMEDASWQAITLHGHLV